MKTIGDSEGVGMHFFSIYDAETRSFIVAVSCHDVSATREFVPEEIRG
jgi:hypothetical protein